MRLTTLARKIQITPTKLIEFLTKQNIKIDNGINTKLDDEIVRMTMEEFMPDAIEEPRSMEIEVPEIGTIEAIAEPLEILETETKEAPEAIAIEAEVIQEVVVQEESVPAVSDIKQKPEPKAGTIEDLEMSLSEDIELIRAKKVKLEGIKVVGKIELPEKPKKAEAKADEENAEEQPTENAESKKVRPPKERKKLDKQRNHNGKKSRKPLSYEERLKIEEREKRRIRKQKERKEKERKKKYYLENIQPKTTGQTRKKKKQSVEIASGSKKAAEYKNPLRRLWAWLNGEYDKY
jgi:hypothetical protein